MEFLFSGETMNVDFLVSVVFVVVVVGIVVIVEDGLMSLDACFICAFVYLSLLMRRNQF